MAQGIILLHSSRLSRLQGCGHTDKSRRRNRESLQQIDKHHSYVQTGHKFLAEQEK